MKPIHCIQNWYSEIVSNDSLLRFDHGLKRTLCGLLAFEELQMNLSGLILKP